MVKSLGTVATIVIETLLSVPLPDIAQYHQIPFPVPTGFFQSISSDSPVPLPDVLHWCIDMSGSETGESLEMLWKKPVLSSWNWKRNLVVLGYIWKWNWKKCFNYYGRYCSYISMGIYISNNKHPVMFHIQHSQDYQSCI